MFDITTEAKLFEDYLAPGVIAEIAQESKIVDRVEKTSKHLTLGGTTAKQKVLIEASQAARAANNSTYPIAQESTPEETHVYLKRSQMFTIKLDGFALECAQKGGTVQAPLDFEKTGIFITVRNDMSRQLMMDGSGRLCQANGAGSGATALIVDSPYFSDPTIFVKKNRVIDAYLAAAIEINSIKVTAVAKATKTLTVASSTWTDDAWVLNEDTYRGTETPGQGEMMGLLGICSDADPPTGALQGLLVGSYPEWKAVMNENGGVSRPYSDDLLISVLDQVVDWGMPTFALITRKIRRAILAQRRDKISYAQEKALMWGGWIGIPFYYDGKEIPLVVDKYVPDGMIIGGDESKLTIHATKENMEPTWEKGRDGSILQKVSGKNEYQAEAHIFSNLGVSVRRAFFRVADIQEPS